jgi:signal transduction histidine kinase
MRLQLKSWVLGLAVTTPLGLTNLLPTYGIFTYPLGNLGSAVWAAIVAYAIVRHRLMDIDVVVTKGIAYVGAVLVLVGPVFFVTLMMQRWAFGDVHYDFSLGLAILLILVGTLFPPLRAQAESHLQRTLFPQKYESRASLAALAGQIVRILDREQLIEELCQRLVMTLGVDRVALYLRDDDRLAFQLRRTLGISPAVDTYGTEHEFVRWLARRGIPVLKDESVSDQQPRCVEVFRVNGWEVCVPFVGAGRLLGFLGVGRKEGLDAFAAGDLGLLDNVAAAASVALENARLYEEVRRSRDIINRAGRLSALGTLAAGIAHEIRNPLVSIQTFFQLAPRRLDDEEFMSSFLRLAEAEVQRISKLISELLMFAKSPSADVREVDVNELVDRTVTLLAPQARREGIELSAVLGKTVPAVHADPDQVLQVLINIALNGIQATSSGGRVTIETRQIDQNTGVFSQIEVRDTGHGIPAAVREAIFNPFFTTREKGTGLGLSIAHQIIAEAGGFIAVDSVEGQGTRFAINMPAIVTSSTEESEVRVAQLSG